jgi:ABC-2 type transport system permease protein
MKTLVRAFVGEYERIFRDWGALLILVVALVLYAFFYPIPYMPEVLKEVPVAVVDLDRSELSRHLARMLDAHELIRVQVAARSVDEAERLARAGAVGGVVVIPEGFERKVRRNEQATVSAYADASYFLIYRQVLTGALEATGTLSAGIEIRRLQAQGLPADAAMRARDPLPLVARPLFNPAEGYGSYVVPAVLVLILQQTLLVGIGLVGGTSFERQQEDRAKRGAWRAATFPASLATLCGRALAYFLLYLVHLLFYFGVVFHLFGFPERAPAVTLLAFATPFLLSVIFLALAVRAAFRTRERSTQVLLFTSLPALFVAGFSWPVEAMPRWVGVMARALPSTPAIAGFLRLSQMGATLAQVRAEWLLLWGLCGTYFALAWLAEWRDQTPRESFYEKRKTTPEVVRS